MNYTTVFWDFNGTIADDVRLGIDSVNRMLKKRGLGTIDSIEQYHRLFRFPVSEYYRLLGFDFSKEPYEDLAVEWVELYTEGEHTIAATAGFHEVWQHLHSHGVRQIILSSSETEMLHRQLAQLGLQGKFDRVIGSDNIYAGGKIETARRVLGGNAAGAVLIGDTTHDAETARAIGADCILYAGGHGSAASLAACGVPVVERLSDLIGML
jgi:phosphoglycolate phosphatase